MTDLSAMGGRSMPAPEYLRCNEAAEYIRSRYGFGSVKTLRNLVSKRTGPRVYRAGGWTVLYRPEDLDAWAQSRIRESA